MIQLRYESSSQSNLIERLAESVKGGFQLEFVSISWVINHMTCYNLSALIGGKFLLKKNPLQDLLSSLNAVISTNESGQIITGHVIYNPAYTYKFQLKTTIETWEENVTNMKLNKIICVYRKSFEDEGIK